jgi:hypothetical protein
MDPVLSYFANPKPKSLRRLSGNEYKSGIHLTPKTPGK